MGRIKSIRSWRPTKDQERRMYREIGRQIDEQIIDLEAVMLYALCTSEGYGRKRLRRFYAAFNELYFRVLEHYNYIDAEDVAFVCKTKLKQNYGIDVAEWDREEREKRREGRNVMTMMPMPPCKRDGTPCIRRKPGYHSSCEPYKEYVKALREENDKLHTARHNISLTYTAGLEEVFERQQKRKRKTSHRR